MVFDCFPFFNELDVLDIRLNVLKDVVDRFVLVEAGETHTGKPKPFYFEENRSRFAAFENRIVYIKIEKMPSGLGAWGNENYQRNALLRGLVEARDDDDIILSDLDEIPNPAKVRIWKGTPGIKVFCQSNYAFYLNFLNVRSRSVRTAKMFPWRFVKEGVFDDVKVLENEFLVGSLNRGTTLTKIRRCALPKSRGGETVVADGGWHFSCMGGAAALVAKMRAVAPHGRFDPADSSLTERRMARMIERGRGPALKMNCFAVPLDESFPEFIRENQVRYGHLLFKDTPAYRKRVRLARTLRTWQGLLIQFAETACPVAFHNWLHLVKMRLLECR